MYYKLAVSNMKRSLRDYLIYFITVILVVSVTYSFLSLAFSEDIMSLAENISMLSNGIIVFSFVVALISGFMICHTINFILIRRKKEIALYMLMGMEETTVCKLFLYENIFIGTAAFLVGCLGGCIIAFFLKNIIRNVFGFSYIFAIDISLQALLITFILYICMYVFALIKSVHSIKKSTLITLLYDNIRNEKCKFKKKVILHVIIACLLEIFALIFIQKGILVQDNTAIVIIIFSLAVMLCGVCIFYNVFPDVFLLISKRCWKWRLKGTNLYLIGQIVTKSKTAGKIMAITAVLLTGALATMFVGFVMGAGYKVNMEAEYPYDIAIAIDSKINSFDEVIDYISQKESVEESISYNLYEAKDLEIDILSLSDYNSLRNIIGLEEKKIGKNEYIVHCDTWYLLEKIKERIGEEPNITLDSFVLHGSLANVYSEPIEQYRMAGTNGYAIVVPDYITEGMDTNKSRLAVKLEGKGHQQLRNDLNQYIRKDWDIAIHDARDKNITISISVKAWGVANSLSGFATLSFCGLYLSIIFIIISGILLTFEQLEKIDNNKKYYNILNKIGVDKKGCQNLIFKELTAFFIIPLVLPTILFVVLVIGSHKLFARYILSANVIPLYACITLSIFLAVYLLYFAATYLTYKNIILRKTQ